MSVIDQNWGLRMWWWCANQWQLSWDSTSYQKRNNTRSSLKNTSYYCYKAQLQFAGWLKQHVRRTGFRGQRCLPGGEGESCPGSWHLDKLLERSRCSPTEAQPWYGSSLSLFASHSFTVPCSKHWYYSSSLAISPGWLQNGESQHLCTCLIVWFYNVEFKKR